MRDLDTRSRFTRERSPDSFVTRVSAGCPFVKDASYPTHADTLRMLTATQMPAHPMRDRESQRERETDRSKQAGRSTSANGSGRKRRKLPVACMNKSKKRTGNDFDEITKEFDDLKTKCRASGYGVNAGDSRVCACMHLSSCSGRLCGPLIRGLQKP